MFCVSIILCMGKYIDLCAQSCDGISGFADFCVYARLGMGSCEGWRRSTHWAVRGSYIVEEVTRAMSSENEMECGSTETKTCRLYGLFAHPQAMCKFCRLRSCAHSCGSASCHLTRCPLNWLCFRVCRCVSAKGIVGAWARHALAG